MINISTKRQRGSCTLDGISMHKDPSLALRVSISKHNQYQPEAPARQLHTRRHLSVRRSLAVSIEAAGRIACRELSNSEGLRMRSLSANLLIRAKATAIATTRIKIREVRTASLVTALMEFLASSFSSDHAPLVVPSAKLISQTYDKRQTQTSSNAPAEWAT